jgi:uncharacterized protein DUF6348
MSTHLQTELLRLFERQDVELEPDEDWLLTDGDFPAIRASWHEGKSAGESGRLDIDVVLDEERQIELSYAGNAPGGGDALERFSRSDLPVLLAACWYVTDERKLDLAQWEIGVRSWDAFIGRCTVDGADIAMPDTAWPAITDALRNESLAPRMHWVRLFLRHAVGGAPAIETLLDNEPWPAGDRALAALDWPASTQAYSVRGLLVLDVRDY